jgi:hypothetical protein
MQRLFLAITAALVLCALQACSERQPDDTVESLIANPQRLKELQAQCKAEHDKLGDVVCNRVAEVTRRRFMAPAASPYTTDPVRPALPAAPASRE